MRIVAILAGFLALYLLLDRTAAGLQSFRGEWGVPIAALVVAAALLIEWLLNRRPVVESARELGLRAPHARALLTTLGLVAVLVLVLPAYCWASGTPFRLVNGWPLLALGIFAQAGIAEETVFRGFLFRHFREGRSFWPAALWAAIPFVLVHLLLFLTMEPVVAAMALIVSLSLTFPFAWLFEQSGNSIWPPAILHAVVQGAIKLVDTGDGPMMALVWMLVSAALPWALFLLLRKPAQTAA